MFANYKEIMNAMTNKALLESTTDPTILALIKTANKYGIYGTKAMEFIADLATAIAAAQEQQNGE